MGTSIAVHRTPRGLLIPRAALGDWYAEELEAVWEKQAIVIRPKPARTSTRDQVRQVLREAGMLYEPHWETPPPVSPEERARLRASWHKASLCQRLSLRTERIAHDCVLSGYQRIGQTLR